MHIFHYLILNLYMRIYFILIIVYIFYNFVNINYKIQINYINQNLILIHRQLFFLFIFKYIF